MAQQIIRFNQESLNLDTAWEDVTNKPEEFPPATHQHQWNDITGEPDFAPASHTHSQYAPTSHNHEWGDILNEPDFAPASHTHSQYAPVTHQHQWNDITGEPDFAPATHTHPMNQIMGEIVSNYDPPIGNRPRLIWTNVGADTNSPNDGPGWSVFEVPWADQNFSFKWQIGAHYNDSPQGLYWRQTKNLPNQPWRRIWDDSNFPVSIGTWTATVTGSTGAGNPSYIGGKRVGRYIRQGSLVLLEFHLQGSFTTAPTGDVRISGIPAALVPNTDPDYEFNQLAIAADVGWEGISAPLQYIIKGNTNYIGLYSCGFSALPINWNSRGVTSFLFKGSIRYRL